jgi:hypothetical protein
MILLAVLVLHLLLVALLVVASKQRRFLGVSTSPIELLLLPPRSTAAARVLVEQTVRQPSRKIKSYPGPVNELTLAPRAPESEQSSGAAIDWAREAQSVAATMASKQAPADRNGAGEELRAPKSMFPEPPAHHAGDEITMPSGERAVFINDSCYQIASSQPANASNNGMVNPTYCVGKSNTPRGDLFEQLPAYKKHHPN